MLEWLQRSGAASERKLRLFACACCRRVHHLLSEPWSREAIDVAERLADGLAAEQERETAWDESMRDIEAADMALDGELVWFARLTAHNALAGSAVRAAQLAASTVCRSVSDLSEASQAALLRDIVGNPFQAIPAASNWLTATVVNLTKTIYDNRAFDRLPELANALEQAGCTNHEILDHCRQPSPHVRGCWVVDLVLVQHP